jgi:hypothetical protein
MPTTKLLETLLEIERAVGHKDDLTIRAMLMEAQTELLRVQADVIRVLEEVKELRERQERYARSGVSPIPARAEWATRPTPVLARTA